MNKDEQASCYICTKFNVCILAHTIDENVRFFDVDKAEQAQIYHVIGKRCKHYQRSKEANHE